MQYLIVLTKFTHPQLNWVQNKIINQRLLYPQMVRLEDKKVKKLTYLILIFNDQTKFVEDQNAISLSC